MLFAGPERHSCQASETELMLPLVSYSEGAWMRLALEHSVPEAGAVTGINEPGLVSTPLTLSPCTSAAFELIFIAEMFSAMILATASGSPTVAPPHNCLRQACMSCSMSPMPAETSSSACLFALLWLDHTLLRRLQILLSDHDAGYSWQLV